MSKDLEKEVIQRVAQEYYQGIEAWLTSKGAVEGIPSPWSMQEILQRDLPEGVVNSHGLYWNGRLDSIIMLRFDPATMEYTITVTKE